MLEGSEACFAPVLTMTEAPEHPHASARNMYVEVDGVQQPMPAPRFGRTPAGVPRAPRAATREEAQDTLAAWFGKDTYGQLDAAGKLSPVQGWSGA